MNIYFPKEAWERLDKKTQDKVEDAISKTLFPKMYNPNKLYITPVYPYDLATHTNGHLIFKNNLYWYYNNEAFEKMEQQETQREELASLRKDREDLKKTS